MPPKKAVNTNEGASGMEGVHVADIKLLAACTICIVGGSIEVDKAAIAAMTGYAERTVQNKLIEFKNKYGIPFTGYTKNAAADGGLAKSATAPKPKSGKGQIATKNKTSSDEANVSNPSHLMGKTKVTKNGNAKKRKASSVAKDEESI